MSKIKVSILIPVYNVAAYLPECLESVISQTLQDIEIICLNDGSTDSSPAILQEYAEKDPRIKIINKSNSGYGDSMNQGLDLAKGEYIGIVESDDWVEPEMFEQLYYLAKSHNAEVSRSNYFHYLNGADTIHHAIDPAQVERLVDPHQPGENHIFYQAPAIWSAIYKRSFLNQNNIRFLSTPGAAYQDTGFNFKVWACAHKAVFTNNAYLHYRLDNESSSVNSPGKVFNVMTEYSSIEDFLRQHDLLSSLGGIMEAAKFGAYHWNLRRLPYKYAKPFLIKMRTEFQQASQAGLIDWHLINRPALQCVLKLPPFLCYYLDRLRMLPKSYLLPFFQKFYQFLRPSYKRQLRLLHTLNQQNNRISILEQQVHNHSQGSQHV